MFHRLTRIRYTALTREGGYFLLVFLCIFVGAMVREINLMLILGGMMVGPLILSWFVAVRSLRSIKISRDLPQGVCAGDLLVVEISAKVNRRAGPAWAVHVEDTLQFEGSEPRQGALHPSVRFAHLEPQTTQRVAYRGRLTQRGRYRLGPLRVSTRFPLGLIRRVVTHEHYAPLTVYPRLGRLTRRWSQLYQESMLGSRKSRHRHGLLEGDFHGLRDWRVGDSRRWIHWRTSARQGSLMVRQFEQPTHQDLAVLIDLYQSTRPSDDERDNLELAVSFAATIAADLCRRGGSQLVLGTAGPTAEWIQGIASRALLQEIMEGLAIAKSTTRDQLPQLIDRVLDVAAPGARILIVTTRPTELNDPRRFISLWQNPRKRAAIARSMIVDTSSEALLELFQIE